MKPFQHRWVTWAVGVLAAGAAFILIGRGMGQWMAEQDKERLQLLWPEFMAMPEYDRALIVRSAMECKVYRQPVQAEAVAQCLRDGAERIRSDDVLAADRIVQLLVQIER